MYKENNRNKDQFRIDYLIDVSDLSLTRMDRSELTLNSAIRLTGDGETDP